MISVETICISVCHHILTINREKRKTRFFSFIAFTLALFVYRWYMPEMNYQVTHHLLDDWICHLVEMSSIFCLFKLRLFYYYLSSSRFIIPLSCPNMGNEVVMKYCIVILFCDETLTFSVFSIRSKA
jgi:hypothetical protein